MLLAFCFALAVFLVEQNMAIEYRLDSDSASSSSSNSKKVEASMCADMRRKSYWAGFLDFSGVIGQMPSTFHVDDASLDIVPHRPYMHGLELVDFGSEAAVGVDDGVLAPTCGSPGPGPGTTTGNGVAVVGAIPGEARGVTNDVVYYTHPFFHLIPQGPNVLSSITDIQRQRQQSQQEEQGSNNVILDVCAAAGIRTSPSLSYDE